MIESQALTCWCPFVRLQAPGQMLNRISTATMDVVNRDPTSSDARYYQQMQKDLNCIGSKCMGWRWDLEKDDGHCGLAGDE